MSTNYFAEITNLEESQVIGTYKMIEPVDKQRSNPNKKR